MCEFLDELVQLKYIYSFIHLIVAMVSQCLK